jgi:hypothetical protein
MMAMTTSNSMSVKAPERCGRFLDSIRGTS